MKKSDIPMPKKYPLQWLTSDGFFMRGKHAGDTVEYVARRHPNYCRWILDNVEAIDPDDRDVIAKAVNHYHPE